MTNAITEALILSAALGEQILKGSLAKRRQIERYEAFLAKMAEPLTFSVTSRIVIDQPAQNMDFHITVGHAAAYTEETGSRVTGTFNGTVDGRKLRAYNRGKNSMLSLPAIPRTLLVSLQRRIEAGKTVRLAEIFSLTLPGGIAFPSCTVRDIHENKHVGGLYVTIDTPIYPLEEAKGRIAAYLFEDLCSAYRR